jgi:DNA-binding NtrC family response regulator
MIPSKSRSRTAIGAGRPESQTAAQERTMSRIMLVDDDRNILRGLGRVIHFMPIATMRGEAIVESFEKPAQALARAAECEFDLVIADYLMPTMNGISFMRRFMDLQPQTPRILLSGYAEILEAMEATREVGPIELLSKPWDDEQLRRTITGLLRDRRAAPAASARRAPITLQFAAVR